MAGASTGGRQAPSMRPFMIVWSGQAISLLGSQLVQFGIVWYLARLTGSATTLALATLIALLPQILLGPFAGVLADRWNRRKVMIAADSGVALASLFLALMFWLNQAPLWLIYLVLLLRAGGAAFHWPAMQASTTLMVPAGRLAQVGGMNQALGGAASILIPPLGALAVESLSMSGVMAIDFFSAIPAILPLFFIPIPQPQRRAEEKRLSVWADLRIGLRFVARWKALMLVMGWGILINMLGQALGSLCPLLVFRHFQGGPALLGWFQSASGVGLLLGGALLGVWGGFKRKIVTQLVFMVLDGAAIVAIGLSPQGAIPLAVGLFFLSSACEAMVIGVGGALFQSIIPPEMQGRLFGVAGSLNQALAPLGLLAAGPTADALGVPFWFVLSGTLFCGVSVAASLVPGVVNIEDPARRPVEFRIAKVGES